MDTLSSTVAAAPSHGAAAAPARPRLRNGLQVDLHITPPGTVALDAMPEHRIKIHAGAPVSGTCGVSRFLYTRGDVDILPAGTADVWEEDQSSTSVMLRFPPSLLQRAAEDMGVDPDRVGLAPRHQFRDPQIEHLAWALDAERQAGHPSGPLYAESLGLALAVHLLVHHRTQQVQQRGLSKAQLRRVTGYVETHLDRDLSLARLAAVAGISASHLKTLFKRSTGLPVHAYVVQRRVERARTLLLRGDLSASQVALEAGFSHQSHMVRCMRRVLGTMAAAHGHGRRDWNTRNCVERADDGRQAPAITAIGMDFA